MEQYAEIQQIKKDDGCGQKNSIYPATVVQAVFDGKTGASLEAILAQFNSIYLQYQGTPQATRNIIPVDMRRAGLTITYMNMESETITERASSAVQKDNDHWGLDVNWSRVDELSLSGDISVSANGTWVINGKDTNVKAVGAKGDSGLTPWLKTIDNKLHFSYDNVKWEECSDYIASYFRFNATSSDSQAGTIGNIQISRDNKTWQDLSPELRNYLRIQGYVKTTSALPKNQVVGTIYGVNEGANTYSLHVWDGSTWVNNGTFTSIAAGVVQETGNSETEVMSQKVVTEKLSELSTELDYILTGSASNNVVTNSYQGDGIGAGYASFLVVDNLIEPFNYKLVAETQLTYVSTDGAAHDFISICNTSAGSATGLSPFAEKRGSIGDTIAAGTVIHEGVFTPSVPSAIFVRTRMSGSVRLEYYIGDEVVEGDMSYYELKKNVEKNSTNMATIAQQVSAQANGIASLSNRLDELDGKEAEVYSSVISGDGVGATTIRSKAVDNVTGLFIYRLIANSDLVYTSSDGAEHTFIDIVYYPTGATTPTTILSELRGNVGDAISKGTIIHEGSTTFDSAVDIWVRSRMSGSVTLEWSYSYGTDGVKETVAKQQVTLENHENRIKTLESSNPSQSVIIEQYKNQINRALQLGYVESRAASDWQIKPLVFIHMSDTHSATNNTRAFELLNYLGAKGNVQFLMHTGDILEDPKNAAQSRWDSIVSSAQYPIMVTPGNHDVGNWATSNGQYTTSVQYHNIFISPIVSKWDLKTDGGGTPYISGKNYYFKDFTEQKIRFIVVDEYELPNQFGSDGVTLLAGRGARWISQEQANWFIDSLSTTPSGYGVIVAKHAPDGKRGEDANAFNSRYLKGKDHQQSYQYVGGVSYTTFFADIVQSFIERTTINKTVNQAAGGIVSDIVINADFSGVNSEFVCYVSGHTHADGINFLKDYPKQLDLNINCNNTFYQHYSDMNLISGTMYEDALNVYSVDRNRGVIHIVRIGGEYSADGDRRDIMTINYRK